MKILAVDDNVEFLQFIVKRLKNAGFKEDVVCAESAEEAFGLLGADDPARKTDIDLILLDIVMPKGLNGIEACGVIKSRKHLRDIPIIMITAENDDKTLEEAFLAGAMDYITKPVNKTELRVRVQSALSLKKEIDQRKAREKELLNTTRLLENANEKLRELSFMDGLTGIANRRLFDEKISEELERSRQYLIPLSVILLDIDAFKPYNDNYGHVAGDDCLKEVAQTVRKYVNQPGSLVARYGGEEFVVVLPATMTDEALSIAEDIRCRIKNLAIKHEYSPVVPVITVSLGVSTARPDVETSVCGLIDNADKALYNAKQNGRNRVEAAGLTSA